MKERDLVGNLAAKILDNPNLDPDSDIAILARHLLRERQTIAWITLAAGGRVVVELSHFEQRPELTVSPSPTGGVIFKATAAPQPETGGAR